MFSKRCRRLIPVKTRLAAMERLFTDGAAALHDGERGLGDEECAGEVGVDERPARAERKVIYREIGVGDAGVVDEDIEVF